MIIRENLASVITSIARTRAVAIATKQVGKVYGVVTTENTPTPAMFKKAGGFNGIGSVFYLDYNQSKNISGESTDSFLDTCKVAKPLHPQFQYCPALGELIFVEDLPSPAAQNTVGSSQKYYISIINLWNNQQQNSQPARESDILGSTLTENPNVRTLIPYQGDNIIQGRQGSSLRFSTTTKAVTPSNEWSSVGNEIDPITILTNGLAYDPSKQYYVEQINKDASSIYLTSTQKIPLQVDKASINSLTNPTSVPDYFGSQVILNADRIVLNSKKDEVMLFAKTNIELNTKNIINLNADERIHLNSGRIFLGTSNNQLPSEPLLLGNQTYYVLRDLLGSLYQFGASLSSIVGSPEGVPATDIITAAGDLLSNLDTIEDNLETILSQQSFTA